MPTLITATSGIVIAVVAAALAYWNAQRLSQRAARLERVNAQLADFYGPMLAHSSINSTAFHLFQQHHQTGDYLFYRDGTGAAPELIEAWKLWMHTVFMPANRAMVEIIINHSHLIDDDQMPDCLVVLLAHISGYEVVLKQWEQGDYSRLTSVIDHPGQEFDDYVSETYRRLKQRQQHLIKGAARSA